MARQIDPMRVIDDWVDAGTVKAASLLVSQHGAPVIKHDVGLARFTEGEAALSDSTLFTIASITKTVTAACFMQYVEEGVFSLSDSPAAFIPEFGREGKEAIAFLHMLTHTSGLHEQVEGKDDLRRREGSMAEFLDLIYASVPLFKPGKGYEYSNCAIGIMARVVEVIENCPFGDVLRARIFEPLGMNDSALGFDESWDARIAEIELPPGEEEERAFVNSRYWRGMGAAWGAMISNTSDLTRFAEAVRCGGALDGARILSPATVAAMTRDHLLSMPGFPVADHPHPLGLVWHLRGEGAGRFFGDLTSPETFGHPGATGTFLWVDPTNEITAVLLSNREQGCDIDRFARLSNAIVASCV